MPIEIFKSVREVSSEDNVHVAANLLLHRPGKKWKTKSVGEKMAYVILELDEPKQIIGIDIGNEHSAFVEVLVGKAGCTREDFKEILITCSFMTPIESKNSSNTNRVRCFGQEALVQATRSEKWQMVKVICTQPFNKHIQYGISFIKVHVLENISKKDIKSECLVPERFLCDKLSTNSTERVKGPFGKFILREDSPDSDSDTTMLFSRWKMSKNKESTTAAAIREASNNPIESRRLSENNTKLKPNISSQIVMNNKKSIDTEKIEVVDRNRDELLFGSDYDQPDNKKRLEAQIEVDKERLRKEAENHTKHQAKTHKINTNKTLKEDQKSKTSKSGEKDPIINSIQPATPETAKKRFSSPTSRPAKKHKSENRLKYRPFNQLMKGVVLVISGIQNPDRSDLRNKALAMGAKYKQDWENGCTHLICAFKNTPKYKQVHGKGKIVTRSWIEQCYTMKKYLPWRRYALDSMELTKPESDEEILDESLKLESLPIDDIEPNACKTDKTLAMYDLDDEDKDITNGILDNVNISSGSDTEDEIKKATEKIKNNNPTDCNKETRNEVKRNPNDIFDVSTEEEEFLTEKMLQFPTSFPQFFNSSKFFICDDVNAVEKTNLRKCIKRYGGIIQNDLTDVQYVISHASMKNVQTFSGEIVQPQWIFECSDMEMKVPSKKYVL